MTIVNLYVFKAITKRFRACKELKIKNSFDYIYFAMHYQKTPKTIKEFTRLSYFIYPYLQNKEQMLKHQSVMVELLGKFETLEKVQKKDIAKKLIDSGMYIPK